MASLNPQQGPGIPVTTTGSPVHLIDELETAFQNCISVLTTQEHFNVQDTDETKTGVEQTLNKFLDLARQTEAHFMQKRLVLSKQKPEQMIKDETEDLKAELEKKDALIKRHQERLQKWQLLLRGLQGGVPGGTNTSTSGGGGGQMTPQGQPPPHPGPTQQQSIPHPVQNMPNPAQMGMSGQHFQATSQPTQMTQGQGQPGMMMSRPPMGQNIQQTPGPPHQPPPAYPQGPLQYLEQTMSSIGMPERR